MTTTATVTEVRARIAGVEAEISDTRDSLLTATQTAIARKELPPETLVTEYTNLKKLTDLEDFTKAPHLRRLKKRQRKIHRLTYKRKRLMAYSRKVETRQKIELGGLAFKAGLRDADKSLILGCLMELQEQLQNSPNSERLKQLKRTGSAALNSKTEPMERSAP